MKQNQLAHIKLETYYKDQDGTTKVKEEEEIAHLTNHSLNKQLVFTIEELKKALETYILFRSRNRGRKRSYSDNFLKEYVSLERLAEDYQKGRISRATYYRYKKQLMQQQARELIQKKEEK